ncbi:2OG-Fe(II) oxygenase superfamily protein [Chitinophaga sp. CF118]|uniref:alpha-ketoglutarate-dependent dioxygenase AlkB n=1 Tax=Chitinophaga sp. CF118 TaxID=1884367 RepID=UPI0008F33C25|nr:alpha-ketoglutarate-dependent dioxygenase AlkB [Chitinophaga sp. CF118]SFE67466.1 2OG-Fe(II) oxygenase superfamily protein [Chitinophaga sp. CF118]
MYDLFNPIPEVTLNDSNDLSIVQGLTYIPNYITKQEGNNLINAINGEIWLSDIKRRVQHYGYKYDYKARSIDYAMYLGALPHWVLPISKRLYAENHIEHEPDQLIINEYHPGQGIANHVDCEPCFGETIISLSLSSYCIMDFIHLKTKEKVEVMLEPCSLVVINGDARHNWSHGIAQRKTDIHNNQKINRTLRISMTFRKVLLKQ